MNTIFSLFVLAVSASQIDAARLNITILYETLCPASMNFFTTQLWPTYKDPEINKNVFVELVPFGHATYTEHPWNITCQHGPRECKGNAIHGCFIAKNPDNYKQVAWTSCTMDDDSPPTAGEECADKLNYSYDGVNECSRDKEGIALQIKNGERTQFFKDARYIPSVIYNNVFNTEDNDESLENFKAVVLRKLKVNEIPIE